MLLLISLSHFRTSLTELLHQKNMIYSGENVMLQTEDVILKIMCIFELSVPVLVYFIFIHLEEISHTSLV
jgi:hypothetical protein